MSGPKLELAGRKFGKLTALSFSHTKDESSYWLCICECGLEKVVMRSSLLTGNTQSCGCMWDKTKFKKEHGLTRSKSFRSWECMVSRCYREKDKSYKRYGGRGIKVCERWLVFAHFYEDMGERPEGQTLDRIDNDGDYELANCRWAIPKDQSNNRSNSVLYNYRGEKLNIYQLARIANFSNSSLRKRIEKFKGDIEMAMWGPRKRSSRYTEPHAKKTHKTIQSKANAKPRAVSVPVPSSKRQAI